MIPISVTTHLGIYEYNKWNNSYGDTAYDLDIFSTMMNETVKSTSRLLVKNVWLKNFFNKVLIEHLLCTGTVLSPLHDLEGL